MKHKKYTKKGGYILLMSVLIISIILSISFGIFALSMKDVILASYLKDSAKAFGAADKGVECALYWDRATPQNGRTYTIFTTSTQYVFEAGGVPSPFCDTLQLNTLPSWSAVNAPDPNTGTTNFSLAFGDGACAEVTVYKEGNSTTTFVSNGYNTCVPSARRTQRTIQVSNSDGGDAAFAVTSTCPFQPQAGRYIANWATDPTTYLGAAGRRIHDNGVYSEATLFLDISPVLYPTGLPVGNYTVRAYGYDAGVNRATGPSEPNEQFYVEITDNNEIPIAISANPTSDLTDGVGAASTQDQLDAAMVVPAGGVKVKAYHYIWRQTDLGNTVLQQTNEFQPICVALDKN